jgi:hypothetical protein
MQHRVRALGWIAITAVLVLGMSGGASAGDRDHDGGFFLRLSGGAGAASTTLEDSGDKLKLSGVAADINLAIGAIVAPNLALHGTLFGWLISDPDAELNNESGSLNGDLNLNAIGAGLTYYIMPANVYLSGSVGIGKLSFDAGDGTGESDAGPVVDFTLGKEWWVGRKWALGVAAALGLHSIPEKGVDENWSGASFAVRFSATMN